MKITRRPSGNCETLETLSRSELGLIFLDLDDKMVWKITLEITFHL